MLSIAHRLGEPAYGLDDVHTTTPMASPETPTTYSVYVRNDYGCRDTARVFVDVYPHAVVHLPDTITLYPGERYHLQPGTNAVYFEWSRLPASAIRRSPYNEVPQPLGVYVYLVDAITVEGERVVRQENVTLVK